MYSVRNDIFETFRSDSHIHSIFRLIIESPDRINLERTLDSCLAGVAWLVSRTEPVCDRIRFQTAMVSSGSRVWRGSGAYFDYSHRSRRADLERAESL